MYSNQPLTSQQRADLHAQARHQAQHLRDAAVTAFWYGIYQQAANVLRAAHRMLHRTGASTGPRKPSGV